MLAEMLVRISEELLEVGRTRVGGVSSPREASLAALVEWHTDFALRHRSLIVVQDRDWESLPRGAREQVRALQRAYVDLWAERAARDRPGRGEWDDGLDGARAAAHAAFGLLNSTPHSALLPDEQMRELLARWPWPPWGSRQRLSL